MIVVHYDVLSSADTAVGNVFTRTISPEGRRLWATFFEAYSGRMVITADPGTNYDMLKEWLKRENFKPSFIFVAEDACPADTTPRAYAAWQVHTTIGKIDWYLDTDGPACARAIRYGIPTLLVGVPHFIRPEFLVDSKTIKPWDQVAEELDAQAIAKSERTWDEV